MDCTICNNPASILYENLNDTTHHQIKGKYTLKSCDHCNLIFVDPQPSMEKLAEHYPEDYHVYTRAPEAISAKKALITHWVANNFFGYGSVNPLIKPFLYPFYYKLSHLPHKKNNGLILDIGCGTGTRLPLFKLLGWKVEGVEPSEHACKTARKAGFTIHHGFFDELNLPDNYCDAIYLNNVFEHIPDLHLFLSKVTSVLKENGELILVVPNTKSLTFKLFKKNWYALDVPRHLYDFDEYNLTQLLTSHDFSIKQISYCNFLGSLTSSLALKKNKKPSTYTKFDRLLWALSFVMDPLMNRFKSGDWLVVHANLNKNR